MGGMGEGIAGTPHPGPYIYLNISVEWMVFFIFANYKMKDW